MMIYILDNNTKKTAEYLDDLSLDKMIQDISQVLINCHWIYDHGLGQHVQINNPPMLYKVTKKYYKWTKWARECKANYLYLIDLLDQLLLEGANRHDSLKAWNLYQKYSEIFFWARKNVPNLPNRCHSCALCCNEFLEGCEHCQEKLELPLIMPKKYLSSRINTIDSDINFIYETQKRIINNYRNYYQAKLEQRYYKHLNQFRVRPQKGIRESMFNKMWTNRAKPYFIKL